MKVKVKSNIKWSMCFAPVMSCEGLELEEKLVLNIIMSMKNSFDNVYATSEMIMKMTGLSSDQYESAVSGLAEKKLVVMKGKDWRIIPDNINSILGVEVYDLKKLYASKNQPKSKEPKVFHYTSGVVNNPYYQEN